jgi:DNA-binding winged helix-turn-helix (wHTH) protein
MELHTAGPDETADEVVEYAFGPFRLDTKALQLYRGDEPVALTPKAFDTLLELVRNDGRLVRKESLLQAVWPGAFASEDSLTQNITALRKALGDHATAPDYIETKPRRGYRFVAPVARRVGPSDTSAVPGTRLPTRPDMEPPVAVPPAVAPAAPVPGATWGLWAAGALAVVLAVIVFAVIRPPAAPPQGSLHPAIDAPPGTRLVSGVLSPGGDAMVLLTEDEATGETQLWTRTLASSDATPLPGTGNASWPFWSPDGNDIGFFAGAALKRVGRDGANLMTLTPTVGLTAGGGTWGDDGTLLFAHFKSGIDTVPATGGEARAVTALDAAAGDVAHRWPQFLPSGRDFLYSVNALDPARSGTWLSSLDPGAGAPVRLLDVEGAVMAAPGVLVYVRDGALMAQRFDLERRRSDGPAVALVDGVAPRNPSNNRAVSAAPNGLLAFTTSGQEPARLVWLDRSGAEVATIAAPDALFNPSMSRDERYLAAGSGADVWLVDVERNASTRVFPGHTPLLSPDGGFIAFTSTHLDGIANVFARDLASSEERLLVQSPENKFVSDLSLDGRHLVYASTNPETKMDLWLLRLDEDAGPQPLLTSEASEFQGQISPDGRWIAYASDESGTWNVYVQAFPELGRKQLVSTGGGSEPQWRPDGQELFYLSDDLTLMAVTVGAGADAGDTLALSTPAPLFRIPMPSAGELYTRRNHYAVSLGGDRFAVNVFDDHTRSVAVMTNWTARLAASAAVR